VPAASGVLANDGDPDSASSISLTAQKLTDPAHGTLTAFGPDGSFTYRPAANYSGPDSFTYRATSGAIQLTATVNLTVNAVNDAPVAGDDSYSLNQGGTLTVPAPGVLANDSDVDSGSLTAVLDGAAPAGQFTLNADGSFTYTPPATFSGVATFKYKASDASVTSLPATVTITVAGAYTFVNVQNAPPSKPQKSGSAIAMQWRYRDATAVVDSGQLTFTITVIGPAPAVTVRNPDPGSSGFRYDAGKKTWSFNLQTKENGVPFPTPNPPNTYVVEIKPNDARYATATFNIVLNK
jgi:VCBS repeat-containing protein